MSSSEPPQRQSPGSSAGLEEGRALLSLLREVFSQWQASVSGAAASLVVLLLWVYY